MDAPPTVDFRGQWPPGEREPIEAAAEEAEAAGLTSPSSELIAPWVAVRQVLETKSLYMASWQGAESGLLAQSAAGLADRIQHFAERELGVAVGSGEASPEGSEEQSLFQLVYRSEATEPMSEADIRELLRTARQNNERLEITGLLLRAQNRFLQVLEGPETAVRDLYATIREDSRHSHVETVFATLISRRTFPDWKMGLEDLSVVAGEEGTSEFLQTGTLEGAAEPLGELLDALGQFKRRGMPVWKDLEPEG